MTVLSVRPKRRDLLAYAGDGIALLFRFTEKTTGAPIAFDGTWRAQVRDRPGSATILANFTVDASEQNAGKVRIQLDALPDTLVGVNGWWDLEMAPVSGQPRTWYVGTFRVAMDVTR